MSNLPPRTGMSPIDRYIEEIFGRLRALEAVKSADALTVENGTVAIAPADFLDVDPKSITLTNPGAGDVAAITAGVIGTYSPILTQASANPTGSWTTGAEYVRVGHVVYVNGNINFGAGFTNGTGFWAISLPFAAAVLFGPIGSALLEGFGHDHAMQFQCNPNRNTPDNSHMALEYLDAVPVSSRQTFDGTAWGATWNGDNLGFNIVYYTNA